MPGFDNSVMWADNIDGRGVQPVVGQFTTNGQLLFGSTSGAKMRVGLPTNSPEIQYTGGVGTGTWTSKLGGQSASGVKFNLSAGVFSVAPNDAGSMTFITQSNTNSGNFIRTNTTTPFSFNDSASGSSTIAGATWGYGATDSTAATDLPFYVYFCLDSTDANPAVILTQIPRTCVAGSGGITGDPATASSVTSPQHTWSFQNVTEANYASSNCLFLGTIRMTKSNNDWAVTFYRANQQGFVGLNQDRGGYYNVPFACHGAAASTVFLNNGGTAPVVSLVTGGNCLNDIDRVDVWAAYNITGGGGGAGAVPLTFANPLSGGAGSPNLGSGYLLKPSDPGVFFAFQCTGVNGQPFQTQFVFAEGGAQVLNTDLENNGFITFQYTRYFGGVA